MIGCVLIFRLRTGPLNDSQKPSSLYVPFVSFFQITQIKIDIGIVYRIENMIFKLHNKMIRNMNP